MRIRTALALGALAVLSVVIGACSLFNRPPIAHIAASVLTGESPLLVTFDGSGSVDLDGRIVAYRWSFSDGTTAQGVTVDHVFASPSPTTYVATLEIEDNGGATSTMQQSVNVEVTPDPGNNPPFPRFTFEPTHGYGPLDVEFDARLTSDADGEVVVYAWDFGDGSTGSGVRIGHTYDPVATTNYPVTLTATDDDGATASMTALVSVYVPEVIPIDAPTAELAASVPEIAYASPQLPSVPSLFRVTFDPEGSVAAPGHEIERYIYTFGDGESASLGSDEPIEHTYRSGIPARTFVASLTVIDDQGLQDAVVVNVTVINDD